MTHWDYVCIVVLPELFAPFVKRLYIKKINNNNNNIVSVVCILPNRLPISC